MFAQPGRVCAAGLAGHQAWFYAGLGVTPNMPPAGGAVPNHALALLLFMLAVPLFTFFISPLIAQLSRKHEFEADAYALLKPNASTNPLRKTTEQRAGQAVQGQRQHADARPAVRALLLLAPAVNAIAFIAKVQDHHPELAVTYSRCVVRFNTHDVGGISATDFDCAARVDALLA
jgi:Zn-dependent protease with chaperone function